MQKRLSNIFLALILFFILAWLQYGLQVLSKPDYYIKSGLGDPATYIWYLNWWPYALKHQLNPLITNLVWYPTGYNLVYATSLLGVYLLVFPLQLIFSAQVAYNVIAVFQYGLAAFTMFLFAYDLSRRTLPSLIAGYLYGFSFYMVAQGNEHLNLTAGVFLLPIMVWLTVVWLHRRLSTRKMLFGEVICFTLLFCISIEIFVTSCLFGYFTICLFWLTFKQYRMRLAPLICWVTLAGLITALIVSPFLYYYFTDHIMGLQGSDVVSVANDFLSLFFPSNMFLISNNFTNNIANQFTALGVENNGYLGIPALILIGIYLFTKIDAKIKWPLIVVLIAAVLISFGPFFMLNGKQLFGILFNKVIFFRVPILKYALPSRFMLFASFVFSVIVLQLLTHNKHKFLIYFFALLCVLFWFPNLIFNPAFFVGRQLDKSNNLAFFSEAMYKDWLPPKSNILMIPVWDGLGTYYHYKTDYYYYASVLYIGRFTPKAYQNNSTIALIYNDPQKVTLEEFHQFIESKHIQGIIVLDKESHQKWQPYLNSLAKPQNEGGVWLYNLEN